MKPSVLIVGASRGIGLGFARAYAADGWEVHATTRNIAKPGELGEVPGDVTLYELDVVNGAQIGALAQAFSNRSLDVLIHNAGIRGDGMPRAAVMGVNAEAPFEVVGALLPAVERGGMKKIAILTSQMGRATAAARLPGPMVHRNARSTTVSARLSPNGAPEAWPQWCSTPAG